MSKQQEYRQFAVEAAEIAVKANGGSDKTRLLLLAEAWLDLAERTACLPKRSRLGEHALVQKIFGNDRLEAE
jgi:hypothetical protein